MRNFYRDVYAGSISGRFDPSGYSAELCSMLGDFLMDEPSEAQIRRTKRRIKILSDWVSKSTENLSDCYSRAHRIFYFWIAVVFLVFTVLSVSLGDEGIIISLLVISLAGMGLYEVLFIGFYYGKEIEESGNRREYLAKARELLDDGAGFCSFPTLEDLFSSFGEDDEVDALVDESNNDSSGSGESDVDTPHPGESDNDAANDSNNVPDSDGETFSKNNNVLDLSLIGFGKWRDVNTTTSA